MSALTLAQILPTWMQAKEDERKAIEYRRSLDKLIQAALPTKDEGSISKSEGNYKVTVTYKVDRKLDTPALQSAWHTIPERTHGAIKWKAEVSTTNYRELSDEDKSVLAAFITTKPASPTVSVDFKE